MFVCAHRDAGRAGDGHVKAVGKGCGACAACTANARAVQRAHRKADGPRRGETGGLLLPGPRQLLPPSGSPAQGVRLPGPRSSPREPAGPAARAGGAAVPAAAPAAARGAVLSLSPLSLVDLTVDVVDLTVDVDLTQDSD